MKRETLNIPFSETHLERLSNAFTNTSKHIINILVLSQGSARHFPAPLETSVRYSATAERCSLLSFRASVSQTQQWTPRRPE